MDQHTSLEDENEAMLMEFCKTGSTLTNHNTFGTGFAEHSTAI
jgi:hypothetical protein